MQNSFYTNKELRRLNFKYLGDKVLISRKCSIYNSHEISIGSNTRIDDFCVLSGKIVIGCFVHISAYTALYGKFEICIEDYSTISGRVMIYSQNDDYSGDFLTNPMVPELLTNVTGGLVHIKKYAIIGSGAILMPHIIIGEGVAIGALSFVNKNIPDWEVHAGVPARFIKKRSKKLLKLV